MSVRWMVLALCCVTTRAGAQDTAAYGELRFRAGALSNPVAGAHHRRLAPVDRQAAGARDAVAGRRVWRRSRAGPLQTAHRASGLQGHVHFTRLAFAGMATERRPPLGGIQTDRLSNGFR